MNYIKVTLHRRDTPVKLTLGKKETFTLKGVYYMIIDVKACVAYVYNTYTHVKHTFNSRGFFIADKRVIRRLKENIKIDMEEATNDDFKLIKNEKERFKSLSA